jgi:hypothetical protein
VLDIGLRVGVDIALQYFLDAQNKIEVDIGVRNRKHYSATNWRIISLFTIDLDNKHCAVCEYWCAIVVMVSDVGYWGAYVWRQQHHDSVIVEMEVEILANALLFSKVQHTERAEQGLHFTQAKLELLGLNQDITRADGRRCVAQAGEQQVLERETERERERRRNR